MCNDNYHPFRTGPFVPVFVTILLTYVVGNVEKFYSGATHMHDKTSNFMTKIFPEEKSSEIQVDGESKKSLKQKVISSMNRKTNGMVDYMELALGDMHAKEMYLSFMLAFEEKEVFSDMGYTLVCIKGAEEAIVFDDAGELYLKVYDGMFGIKNQKIPVVATPGTDRQLLIGTPSNRNFNVVFTDETLLNSPIEIVLEHYTSAGIYHGSTAPQRLHVRKGKAYRFSIGQDLLDKPGVREELLSADESAFYINEYGMNASYRYRVYPEFSVSSDFDLSFGMHFGVPSIYGTVLIDQPLGSFGDSASLLLGFGRQMTLYKTLYLDLEAFSKFSFHFKGDEGDDRVCLIPSLRSSVSYKMFRASRMFAGLSMDIRVDGFNDDAFSSKYRNSSLSGWQVTDNLEIVPSIQVGFKF